jgi:hypothetical protein
MSSGSAVSPFDPERENWWSKQTSRLAKQLCNASLFLRGMRLQLRHGDLTRAPLHLLRFQLQDRVAECDWLARPSDIWDRDLRPEIGQRHASLQALKDAIDIRGLLFTMIPDLETAYLRIYRESTVHGLEMIISGQVQRHVSSFRSVHSIAMRAKLMGFRFALENEILCGRVGEEAQKPCGERDIAERVPVYAR